MFENGKGGMKAERERERKQGEREQERGNKRERMGERERENWKFSPGPDTRSWFDDPWNNKSERSEMYLYWSN